MPGERPEQAPRPQQPSPAQQPTPAQQPAQQQQANPRPTGSQPVDGMNPLAAYGMDMATEIKKIDSAKNKAELDAMLKNYMAIRDKINGVTPQGPTVNQGGPTQRPGSGTPTQSPFAARAAQGGSWLAPQSPATPGQPAPAPGNGRGR